MDNIETRHRRSNSLPAHPKVKKTHKRNTSLPTNLQIVTQQMSSDGAVAAGNVATKQQRKQLKLKCSCIPCRKLHQKCEGMESGGPCTRCIRSGRPELCVVGEQRKRGPRKGWLERKNARVAAEQQKQRLQAQQQQVQIEEKKMMNIQEIIPVPASAIASSSHALSSSLPSIAPTNFSDLEWSSLLHGTASVKAPQITRVASLPDMGSMFNNDESAQMSSDAADAGIAEMFPRFNIASPSQPNTAPSYDDDLVNSLGVVPSDLLKTSSESLPCLNVFPEEQQQPAPQHHAPIVPHLADFAHNFVQPQPKDTNDDLDDLMFVDVSPSPSPSPSPTSFPLFHLESSLLVPHSPVESPSPFVNYNNHGSHSNILFSHCEMPFVDFNRVQTPMGAVM